jgi:hypothetical protein
MARTIFVEVIGNASQFKKELTGAVAATNRANSGFQRMGRVAGVAGGILATGLAVGLVKAAKGAMEDQVEMERLATAFKNAHVAIGPFTKRIAETEEAGRKLGFQDEEVARSLGTIITATHNGTKAIQLNATAMDIARFKHVDLAEASKMLTSTMAGNVRSAKALGIILLPVTSNVEALRAKYKALGEAIPPAELRTAKFADKQATAEQAIRKVNEAVKGQADAFGGTAQGKLAIFNARMDELRDNLGASVLPALVAVTEKLSVFAGFLAKHETLAKALVIGLAGLAAGLLAFSAAATIATAASAGILLPVAAAVVGIAALSFIVYKLVSDFRANWPLLLPIVLGPLGAIIAACIHWHSQIAGVFTAAWNAVKAVTTATWNAITTTITTSLNTTRAAVVAGVNAVVNVIHGAVGATLSAATSVGEAILHGVKSGVERMLDLMRSLPGKIRGAVGDLSHLLFDAGAAVIRGLISGIESQLGALYGKVKGIGGAIKGLKGPIDKDRLLLFNEGAAIIEGLTGGMSSSLPKLFSLAKGIGPSLQGMVKQPTSNGNTGGSFGAGPSPALAGADGTSVLENHIDVFLDGKQIWSAMQRQGVNYSARNAAAPF